MSKICRLLSTINSVPNQVLTTGQELTIGRNRECLIRDIKCSRSHCSVTFHGNYLSVRYLHSEKDENLTNGQFLVGNGFKYKLVFVEQNEDSNDSIEDNFSDETKDLSFDGTDGRIANDSKANPLSTEWRVLYSGRVHICRFLGGGQSSRSIAAFDFDGTLVDTKSGAKFANDSNDWKLIDRLLPKKMEKLIENGYRFVCISNQLPISQGRSKLEDIKHRFESALTAIGFPCLVMIAAFDDIYRKPRPGLWRLLADEFNDDIPIDVKTSYFVGDAAGRKKQLNGKSDHSLADILFAANSDIPFLTPERFLSESKPQTWNSSKTLYSGLTIGTFRPQKPDLSRIGTKIDCELPIAYKDINELLANYSGKLHVIVFCGLAASGKSSFYSNHLQQFGYNYISRDGLKTMEKCQKVCEQSLKDRQNCVIDNTNVEMTARKRWIDICKKYSAIPVLFYFDVSADQALHNNKFRRIIGSNSPVTDLVIRSQNKNLVEPMAIEGFDSIIKINFLPKFKNSENESIYFMYLSEI